MKNLINICSSYVPHSFVIGLILVFIIGILTAFHGCGLPRQLPKNHICGDGCTVTQGARQPYLPK